MRRHLGPPAHSLIRATETRGAGVTELVARGKGVIDYEQHWSNSVETYSSHPTSRHRRRFILERLQRICPTPGMFVFDYGCGVGLLLERIQSEYSLDDQDLGGCDISTTGIREARRRIPGGDFVATEYPSLMREIDVAITSEVIEHTAEYRKVLEWLAGNLKAGGHLIITTPGGTMDPPDEYYGHIQHFRLEELTRILEEAGLEVRVARTWGFPLFTLQKWVTRRNFDSIRDSYMHRSEEHTSELQSQSNLVCRLLLEKKNKKQKK